MRERQTILNYSNVSNNLSTYMLRLNDIKGETKRKDISIIESETCNSIVVTEFIYT